VTMIELKAKLGRQPTVNEWLIANGREPHIKKSGTLHAARRKARKSREG
jgi:hypothetical protein